MWHRPTGQGLAHQSSNQYGIYLTKLIFNSIRKWQNTWPSIKFYENFLFEVYVWLWAAYLVWDALHDRECGTHLHQNISKSIHKWHNYRLCIAIDAHSWINIIWRSVILTFELQTWSWVKYIASEWITFLPNSFKSNQSITKLWTRYNHQLTLM